MKRSGCEGDPRSPLAGSTGLFPELSRGSFLPGMSAYMVLAVGRRQCSTQQGRREVSAQCTHAVLRPAGSRFCCMTSVDPAVCNVLS